MPMTPRSNNWLTRSRGIFACSSISRTCGRICAAANSRTLSRNSTSSSARTVSGCACSIVCSAIRRMLSSAMRVHALLAAGLLLLGSGLAAQQPQNPPPQPPAQPQQRPPIIRSGINFVSVDVIVTDKKTGEVVLDMKQDEFEVREDKKPQRVDTFETVKIDAETNGGIAPRAIRSTYDEESEARQPNV